MDFYLTDASGEIYGIINEDGVLEGVYRYNAFGEITNVTNSSGSGIIQTNPFRYKGYYYDVETQLYWVSSRYYSPELCRWISPDSIEYLDPESINGLNLYCYCMNNPIMYADPSGHFPILLAYALIGAAVGALSYTISETISYVKTGEWNWSWSQFAGNTIGGAVGGLLSLTGLGTAGVSFVTGFTSTALGMYFENQYEGGTYSFKQILGVSMINGALSVALDSVMDFIPIKGLNAGRNSYKAIGSQMATKFANGSVKNISVNTIGKIATYNIISVLPGSIVSGYNEAFGINDKLVEMF